MEEFQNINIKEEGMGKGMVLLHGWGQNMQMMQMIADGFKQNYHVINLDLPGFGKSSEPDHALSTEEYADLIHDICLYYQIENPILIAHSFGARIAFRYALKYPVDKMVLTGAAGIRKPRTMLYYCKVYAYKLGRKLHFPLHAGSRDYQAASFVKRGILVQAVNEDITPLLPLISAETLLVFGDRDEETPLWMGEKMEQLMPNATLITIKGDDHFAYYHQSNRFNQIISYFLKGVA